MKFIYSSKELAEISKVGGKGFHLQKLVQWESTVAPFFILSTEVFDQFKRTGQIDALVARSIEAFIAEHSQIVLRSSMIGEDNLDASFAGLFETILNVDENNWQQSLRKIYASLSAERVVQYISDKKIKTHLKMAVVAQKQIQVEKSGVLFTRSPMEPTSLIAIDAATGMGEGVVSGHVEVDHYLISRMGDLIHGASNSVLSSDQLQGLVKESLRLESHFGRPADIEWGLLEEKLYIFQIRPITREFSSLKVFADTNLSESYPASVSPLTAGFVKKAYENVFIEAAHMIGIKHERLQMIKKHAAGLISSVDDHLYYNLENYYAVLRSLPGGEKNIENWHKMIGGKVEGVEVPFHDTYLKPIDLIFSIKSLLTLAYKRKTIYPAFLKDLEALSQSITKDLTSEKSSRELIQYLDFLIERPLGFGLTIINDFFIMLGLGVLSSALKKKGLAEDAIIDLLKTSQGVDSIKPLKAFDELVKDLSEEFLSSFEKIVTLQGYEPYRDAFQQLRQQGWESEVIKIREFLNQYGDRSFEELKLESLPLKNDPDLFKKLLRWGSTKKSSIASHHSKIEELQFNVFEKKMLNFTRECIEFRETTRLWRGRFYHFLRRLVIKLAQTLQNENPRWQQFQLNDFFSINHHEWTSFGAGQLTFDQISKLMLERNWKEKHQSYPEFITWVEEEKLPEFNVSYDDGNELKGQGVSPGIIQGRALVLENPTDVWDNGLHEFILVTKNTDPAWVYIMSRSLGLISEKGSMLSHTAIIGRELGIPTLVGVKAATHKIKTGDLLQIDGASGEIKRL